MAESLQDRLRDHAKAFDGLLSLIPAKMYYGEENTQDQWMKTKQTKAETAAAKRGRLDPDSELNRTAKEVMDERAQNKRKLRQLEQEQDGEDDNDFEAIDGVEAEKPLEGLKKKVPQTNKKQKRDATEEDVGDEAEATATDPSEPQSQLSKKEQKKLAKKEKKEKKKDKLDAKKGSQPVDSSTRKQKLPKPTDEVEENADDSESENQNAEDEPEPKVLPKALAVAQKDEEENGSSAPESAPHSPTFDTPGLTDTLADPTSAATSVSSTVPPSEKPKHIKIPADTTALRARLAARIEALRAARKADGPDGKPIRTRQELIEHRRYKESQRKAHKQELRTKAKIEEAQKREEALASNSPSVMSPAVELDEATGNFSFGRVAFGDGSHLSRDLSYVLNNSKKKGPSDPKTALLKFQNEKKRVQELDDDKRKDIAEKEAWLTARRRAEGEKIHDDEAMLKKAVKRKEVTKKKSEKAWRERSSGVQLAQKERQKKRENNLRQRREDKALGKSGKKKKSGPTKKKARPGFEGSISVGRKK